MATTQLDCSIGIKEESAYGTAVVVDQFPEFISEALDLNAEFAESEGMRPGSLIGRSHGRVLSKVAPGGSIEMEAATSGLGIFLEAALGAVTNTEVPTATGVYQQVHTPKPGGTLKSYTIQKGIPPIGGGDILTHTFVGAMCESIEFSVSDAGYLRVATEWLAKNMLTSEAYAVPSFPSDLKFFNFVHGQIFLNSAALTIPTDTALAASAGGAASNIREFSVKWANGLDSDGFNLGGEGKRTRKNERTPGTLEGSVTAEFDSVTLRDAYIADATLSLVLTFQRPELIGGVKETLQIVLPAVRLNGEVPKSNGGSTITQSVPFVGKDNLTDKPIYVVYRTQDTAV